LNLTQVEIEHGLEIIKHNLTINIDENEEIGSRITEARTNGDAIHYSSGADSMGHRE